MNPAILQGQRLAWSRLNLTRSPVAPIVAVSFVAVVAGLERIEQPLIAADRALTGAACGLALPLVVLALWQRLAPAERLDTTLLPLSRLGFDRRLSALGVFTAVGAAAAVMGAILAATAVMMARGAGDPGLSADLATSAWIGALGGAVYASWLGLGVCVGPRGGGRWALLFLDAWLGTSSSALALVWPRAHLRNLLGADAVLALPQATAVPWLLLLLALAILGALARTPR